MIAPDGSEVRILCQTGRGSMAHFTLAPGAIAKAVAHRTIDEVWYVVSGRGRMWRRLDDQEETVELRAGLSLTIPQGHAVPVPRRWRCAARGGRRRHAALARR